jgi:Zn-dependent protease with chaperone function
MAKNPSGGAQKTGFFKEHILPLFFIFLIPAFSAWFFHDAERRLDEDAKTSVLESVRRDREASDEVKQQWAEFFSRARVSEVMASNKPEAAHLQQLFEPASWRFFTFRWCQRIAWGCLATVAFAFVFVGAGAWYSLRSQAALYRAMRTGWPVIRTVAVLQVFGQGILAVALSYWVTALWMEVYFIKLVGVIGMLAVLGIFMIVKAMFARYAGAFEQQGEVVSEAAAPALWQHVRAISARLGTAPPDQIIAGIDASFYVTEHEVILGDSVQKGRSLFVSLPLLKVLTVEEADAVLGHEMAHFSGDDTLWSRRISPFLRKMGIYLNTLANGGITVPVFHFMHFFWKLYQFSLGRMSRSREFRADGIGASQSSPDALARALVKIVAYCEYRGKTENDIIGKREMEAELQLADRLERGFPVFLTGFTNERDAAVAETPHPFDSHPPLASRLEALGLEPDQVFADPSVHEPVSESWRNAVTDAAAIEARLWAQQEQSMQEFHEVHLAWTLTPVGEEDFALVRRHFPEIAFENGKGETARLDYESIHLSEWPEPIRFDAIQHVELNDSLGKKVLTLQHATSGKPVKLRFKPETFTGGGTNLLAAFGKYYGRHQTAQQHRLRSMESVS